MIKLEEIHRKLAILPLHWDQPSLGPHGRQRINSGIVESDDGYICIDNWVLTKLDEIHQNLAILPLFWESRALGVGRRLYLYR